MSGGKAVVTCQKYQFSENKKIGLFQPKAPRHLALAHVELKREHVVTPAGQPQGHQSVRHQRFEPAALYPAFQQRAAIDDPFGGACRDVEAPHRFIQNVLVKHKTRIVGPRHWAQHICRVRSRSTSATTTRKHLWFYCWTLHSPGIFRRANNEISNPLRSLGFFVLGEYSCRKHTARRMCQLVDSKKM